MHRDPAGMAEELEVVEEVAPAVVVDEVLAGTVVESEVAEGMVAEADVRSRALQEAGDARAVVALLKVMANLTTGQSVMGRGAAVKATVSLTVAVLQVVEVAQVKAAAEADQWTPLD